MTIHRWPVDSMPDVWDGAFLQCGDRPFGLELLIEPKHGIEHDNREDRDGVFVVTHRNRDRRRHDEEHDPRRGQLFPGDSPRAPHATVSESTSIGTPSRIEASARRVTRQQARE